MICIICKLKKSEKDFLNSSSCYKCILEKKKKQISEIKKCKNCGGELPKGRWANCSSECAEITAKKQRSEYWVTVIRRTTITIR